MTPQLIGWIAIGALLVLLALRVPVAIALATVGFGSYVAISGWEPGLFILGAVPYQRVASYVFTVIPLFILMGHFAHHAGFVNDIFNSTQKWLGGLCGGMVHATIAGAAAFGAACGSGMASCAIMGKVAIPEMRKKGVQKKLAMGAVAASGTIAAMIPPSNSMVIFGIITERSIGKLLIAGVFPGIVAALIYMMQVYIRVRLNPSLAPMTRQKITWKEKLISLKGIWGIAFVAITIMGGIYSGVFTPTEAGAFGAFSTFLMALAMRRLKWSELRTVLLDTTKTTGMVFFILVGASVFSHLLAITRIPNQVSELIIGLEVSRWLILAAIMVMYLILGTLIDGVSQMILTLPIIFPAIIALGFDPIWFGVLLVHLIEISLISPPFALNIFVLKGVVPDTEVGEIIRGIAPFLIADIITLILYIVFPQIALWLPSMMKK